MPITKIPRLQRHYSVLALRFPKTNDPMSGFPGQRMIGITVDEKLIGRLRVLLFRFGKLIANGFFRVTGGKHHASGAGRRIHRDHWYRLASFGTASRRTGRTTKDSGDGKS